MKNFDIDIGYLTTEDIVDGCKKKHPDSQKQLYFMYCNKLFTVSCRIMSDHSMAEDALHDAFLLIFRDIGKLRNSDLLLPWMKKVVINTSLKMLQRYRKIEYTDEMSVMDEAYTFNPMDGEQIEKAISLLPEGYRLVFLLVEVEGYKHHEVAEILGISAGTSKSQLYHAKQRLMKMLKR